MPETPGWRDLLGIWADGFGLVGGFVLAASIITFLAGVLTWPVPLIPFTLGVTLVTLFIVGKVFISGNEVPLTLGRLSSPKSGVDQTGIHQSLPPPETALSGSMPPYENSSLTHGTSSLPEEIIERLREKYDLRELRPNLSTTSIEPENVAVHGDDSGVIVAGVADTAEKTFRAYVIPISNTAAEQKVGAAKKVRASITFQDYYHSNTQKIHRCAWLSEKETEIDLPPNGPPRRLIVVTLEGDVFAISRDFDSSYSGPLVTRQPLDKDLYRVAVSLFTGTEATAVKTLNYILEIKRDAGSLNMALSNAFYWKLDHLAEFHSQGIQFLITLHDIQVKADEKATRTYEQGDSSLQRFFADIRVEEKKGEAKYIERIKNWESRAAAFIAQHFGFTEKERFISSKPSIEAGFERRSKTSVEMSEATSTTTKDYEIESLQSTHWTLSDSVHVRVRKLFDLSKGLPF